MFRFLHFPVTVINFAFLAISVDKVIAVTFPLRYHEIMKGIAKTRSRSRSRSRSFSLKPGAGVGAGVGVSA